MKQFVLVVDDNSKYFERFGGPENTSNINEDIGNNPIFVDESLNNYTTDINNAYIFDSYPDDDVLNQAIIKENVVEIENDVKLKPID